LRREINACDAVICLVGYVYGQEPKNRPSGAPRRSYTQLEFDIAEAFGKPIYVFLADAQCKFDPHQEELPELRQLQEEYHDRLKQRPHKRESFRTLDDLRYKIATIRFADPGAIASKPQNLPYLSLGSHFKGREAFLTDLHQRLMATPGVAAAIVARQAIHGLGGVGKTRLAVEYAWRYQADYTALLFVFADTPADLRRNLAALSEPLRLPQQEAQEENVRVAAVLRWLEDKNGWLLILDNVDTDATAQAVEHFLPRLQRGHVLITSRLAHWQGVERLPLDVLSESDAVAFLLERTADFRYATPQDEADAVALARALGRLALALEQAGAYIQHLHCGLGEYLVRWRSQEARVRTWFDERLMRYPRSVAVTWETTLAQLDESAHALLRLLAWLAPDPIPRALFYSAEADEIFATVVAGPQDSTPTSAVSLEEALAALTKYSMVQWTDAANASVQVHRLVQEITRGRQPEDSQRFWLAQALRLVNAALPPDPPPDDVRSWPVWEPFQPHVVFVVDQADRAGLAEPTTRLMIGFGLFLEAKCVFAEAEPLLRRALAIDEAAYGATHPSVATDLNNLASLLQDTNRLGEAEPLFRRALAIDEAAYGATHPRVATDLNNLALLLRDTNRLGEAEPLFRRALAIDEAAYGATHPNVAGDLNNLALLLRDTNRLEEAEPLFRRMVSIMKHFNDSTGHEHPHWRAALANYIGLLQAMDLSEEEIARRLQDVAEPPASRSAPSHASKGF
jgi:tetratricopeptide (TPR) repeat protein